MPLIYWAYTTLAGALFLVLFPAFWCYTRITGKYREHLEERLGVFKDRDPYCFRED